MVQALEGRLLDGPGPVAQLLALEEPGERLAPEVDEPRGGDGERLLEEGVVEGAGRSLPKLHGDKTSARWRARTGEPLRRSAPLMCRRQPASQATTPATPLASMAATFRSRMAVETSGRRTANDPPKPQHSSLPANSTNSAPRRLRRIVRGLTLSPSPRSRWQESW